ncbi:MAG: hypothetical protein AB6733_19220 [Clostridiaceae bacterium]
MNLNEKLNRIDEFFLNLTNEEFENMLDRCGISEIESSKESGMELSLSESSNIINKILKKDKQNLYITENDYVYKTNVNNNFKDIDQKIFIKAA